MLKILHKCLQENVPGSEATVKYLKMIDYGTSAYLDPTLSISDRVKKIWYAVFLARIWRSWLTNIIQNQKKEKKTASQEIKFKNQFVWSESNRRQ